MKFNLEVTTQELDAISAALFFFSSAAYRRDTEEYRTAALMAKEHTGRALSMDGCINEWDMLRLNLNNQFDAFLDGETRFTDLDHPVNAAPSNQQTEPPLENDEVLSVSGAN